MCQKCKSLVKTELKKANDLEKNQEYDSRLVFVRKLFNKFCKQKVTNIHLRFIRSETLWNNSN